MDLSVTARTVILRIATPGPLSFTDVSVYLEATMVAFEVTVRRLKSLVSCVQLLADKLSARITFHRQKAADGFIAFMLSEYPDVSVSPVVIYRKVILRFLPVELAAEAVSEVLSTFGSVISHTMCTSDKLQTGIREVVMQLSSNIPSRIVISGHSAVTYYSDQPRTCFACGRFAHEKKDCPSLSSSAQSIASTAPLELKNTILPAPVASVQSTVALESTQDVNSPELQTTDSVDTLRSNSLQVAELCLPTDSPVTTDIIQFDPVKSTSPLPSIATYTDLGNPFDSPPSPASVKRFFVYYLPFELSCEAINDAFTNYGTVLSHSLCARGNLANGTRELIIDCLYDIPCELFVLGHECVVVLH